MIELTKSQGRILFEQLHSEKLVESLPIRGMMWHVLEGRIKTGKIYADSWPKPIVISCIEHMSEYSTASDFDTIIIYVLKQNYDHLVQKFLDWLNTERNWPNKELIFMGIFEYEEKIIRKLQFMKNENLQHFGYNITVIDPNPEREISVPDGLPEGLYLDKLVEGDVETILATWDYEVPNKVDYFRWMIKTLPQICIRDRTSKS